MKQMKGAVPATLTVRSPHYYYYYLSLIIDPFRKNIITEATALTSG